MNKVLLVDDHQLIRSGLCEILNRTNDFEVVKMAGSITETRIAIQQVPYDVAIVDIRLPDGDGISLAKLLVDQFPERPVLIMSMFSDIAFVRRALESGASGFIGKDSSAIEILSALRSIVSNPRAFISPYTKSMYQATNSHLTPQEQEVLQALTAGLALKEIATKFHISLTTVKTHTSHIYRKLGVRNRTEAAVKALSEGLVIASK